MAGCWPTLAELSLSPVVSPAILPRGAVMLPCDAAPQLNRQQETRPDLSAELLVTHSMLVATPCNVGEVAQLTDDQRVQDAVEWTGTFVHHGILDANTPLAFILRCLDGRLQFAFHAQHVRDLMRSRLEAVSS